MDSAWRSRVPRTLIGAPLGLGLATLPGCAFLNTLLKTAENKDASDGGGETVQVMPRQVEDFITNRRGHGPASRIGGGGLERPIDVQFDRTGTTMYLLDFGVMTVPALPNARKDSGVLWRVTRTAETP